MEDGPDGSSTRRAALPAFTTRAAFKVVCFGSCDATALVVEGFSCRGGFALCEGRSAVTANTSELPSRVKIASRKALPGGGRVARGSVLDLRIQSFAGGRR